MKTTLLTNPFYCYIVSFGIALFIYSWGWSELYPKLTFDVGVFLIISFVIAFIMGKLVNKKLTYKPVADDKKNVKVIYLVIVGYLAEFAYNGGVPLFTLLKGDKIDYMSFGIPTFHVILHTFTSFYTVYMFHQYMSNKNIKNLLYVMLLTLPHILIVNRGASIMVVIACIIVYCFAIGKLLLSRVTILLISTCLFFYGFGYLGNLRSFNGDSVALLKFTSASDNFMNSSVPKEYYWFYLYASSPFANFENATIHSKKHRYDVGTFITWEILPDFISKRIISFEEDYDGYNRLDYSIHPTLTVGSIYFEPFIRLGWYGPIIVFIYYILLVYYYIKNLSVDSPYFVSAISVLCVISALNMFENMMNFSGLMVQLVFPFLLQIVDQYKVRFEGFNFNFLARRIRFRI